jgi:hypothetical protein
MLAALPEVGKGGGHACRHARLRMSRRCLSVVNHYTVTPVPRRANPTFAFYGSSEWKALMREIIAERD